MSKVTMTKFNLHLKAALIVARETKKPIELILEDLVKYIDDYNKGKV